MNYRARLEELTESQPALCVGLDPHRHIVEAFGFRDTPQGLDSWASEILQMMREIPPGIVKPQVALFERHGLAGMDILARLMGELRQEGMLVIGDAKRGDIGSTLSAYAEAWLRPGSDFEVDALTLSPYLGVGALWPAFELAWEHQKGVFVLAATSNPEAVSLQSAITAEGRTVAAEILHDVARWTREQGAGVTVGCVVGGTIDQERAGIHLGDYPDIPILAPGFGAQGARLGDALTLFPSTRHCVPVVARSVLDGGQDAFGDRYSSALRELLQR